MALGWSLWNMIMIVTTILCGLMTDEWDGAQGKPLELLLAGIAVLVVGTSLLGMGA